jgi:tetratricopeptide (TPR) repeat protein
VTRPLFEQYKEALRKGHLAARAGKIDAALAAYGEATRLAPDRAAPHTSSATALHRAGRTAEAQAAFERALAIAPDDEATLRARAVVFEEIGRSASAAADLEHLAEALEAAGRRADSLAAARHAVDLTATPARRRLVARLEAPEAGRPTPTPTARVAPLTEIKPPLKTASPAQQPPAQAPAKQPQAGQPQARQPQARASKPGAAKAAPARTRPSAKPGQPPGKPPRAKRDLERRVPNEAILPQPSAPPAAKPRTAAKPAVPVERRPAPTLAAEPPPIEPPKAATAPIEPPSVEPPSVEPARVEPADPSIPWPAVDLPSPPPPVPVGPPPNVDMLMAEAAALVDAGDLVAARNLMLTAVALHRAAGRPDAALDVCLQLLALAPGDAYVHLAIAGLQLDRGWRTLATEKIALLLRLTALTGDTQAEADVHALAAERVRDEPPAGVGTH